MIIYRNVSVRYRGGVEALTRVNLSIGEGSFVFLVGSTGSGKSTLFKLLYRELAPTEGHVYFRGEDVTLMPPRHTPFLRRQMGVVFQDFRLLPYKSALENVSYALQVIGHDPRDIHRRAMASLRRVGLFERASAMPHELSGGEQQRVSIARALVNEPVALLADEPTGNLDPDTSFEVMQLLESICAEMGTTIVVATHDRDIVDRMARRVIVLEAGRVARDEVGGYDAEIPEPPAPEPPAPEANGEASGSATAPADLALQEVED